jgi:superfamily II DNA or RNA helicase
VYKQRLFDPMGGYVYFDQHLYAKENQVWQCLAGLKSRVCRALTEDKIPFNVVDDQFYSSELFDVDWDGLARLGQLTGQYHQWQEDCLAHLLSTDCGIVEAATGSGKGLMIAALCQAWPNATGVVVTRAREVYGQLYETLVQRLGPSVGRVSGGIYKPSRVTVATADSVYKLGYDLDYVIGDEIHELAAEKYVGLLAKYKRARMYGFTASLKRDDGRHHELEGIFGPVVYSVPFLKAVADQNVVPVVVEWISAGLDYDPAPDMRPGADRERLQVWRNLERNTAIADRAKQIPADEQAVIMTRSVEHAGYLKNLLPDWELCYGNSEGSNKTIETLKSVGVVDEALPRMTASHRRNLRRDFSQGRLKRVIATYIWSTGVDFRNLRWLVRADAGGNSTKDAQIPGRVCRTFGEKQYGTIIDVWDSYAPSVFSRARGRKRNYAERGFHQQGVIGRGKK